MRAGNAEHVDRAKRDPIIPRLIDYLYPAYIFGLIDYIQSPDDFYKVRRGITGAVRGALGRGLGELIINTEDGAFVDDVLATTVGSGITEGINDAIKHAKSAAYGNKMQSALKGLVSGGKFGLMTGLGVGIPAAISKIYFSNGDKE